MTAGDTVSIIIGAGGTGGATSGVAGADGGDSSCVINANTYTALGGKHGDKYVGGSGGSGTIYGASGSASWDLTVTTNFGVSGGTGGGAGGGAGSLGLSAAGLNGGGGAGGGAISGSFWRTGGNGGDGYVWFEYYDSTLNP
jgi:hypothetical protein